MMRSRRFARDCDTRTNDGRLPDSGRLRKTKPQVRQSLGLDRRQAGPLANLRQRPVTFPLGGRSPGTPKTPFADARFAPLGNVTRRPRLRGITGVKAVYGHLLREAAKAGVILHLRRLRPIGPFVNPDEKNRHPLFKAIHRHNQRARQIGSPAFRRVARNKKLQVWMPDLTVIAHQEDGLLKVLLDCVGRVCSPR